MIIISEFKNILNWAELGSLKAFDPKINRDFTQGYLKLKELLNWAELTDGTRVLTRLTTNH